MISAETSTLYEIKRINNTTATFFNVLFQEVTHYQHNILCGYTNLYLHKM